MPRPELQRWPAASHRAGDRHWQRLLAVILGGRARALRDLAPITFAIAVPGPLLAGDARGQLQPSAGLPPAPRLKPRLASRACPSPARAEEKEVLPPAWAARPRPPFPCLRR